MRRAVAACCGSAALALCTAGIAAEQPLWEVGLGVGALAFDDYRGSDEGRVYPVPVPYFVYRGKFLQADREGVRGELFDRGYAELSVSLNATIPVNSEDNAARRGMPDLRPTVELGPSLDLHLWRTADRAVQLDVILPLRVPITIEGSPRSLRWIFAPRINLDIRNVGGLAGWNFGAGVGPLFAADKVHDYYYAVAPRFATAERPAYRPDGGYSGVHVLAALSKRFAKYWVGAYVRYDALSGAEFDASPLVRREHSLAGGIGIAWLIRESKRTVVSED